MWIGTTTAFQMDLVIQALSS